MFGLFGLFGRSREVQRLDAALAGVGVNPGAVPDAVKFATVRQLKDAGGDAAPEACAAAAALLGYCMLGRDAFVAGNGPGLTAAVEARLVAAIEAGDSGDARLVLLSLHAGVVEPGVVARYDLSAQ